MLTKSFQKSICAACLLLAGVAAAHAESGDTVETGSQASLSEWLIQIVLTDVSGENAQLDGTGREIIIEDPVPEENES